MNIAKNLSLLSVVWQHFITLDLGRSVCRSVLTNQYLVDANSVVVHMNHKSIVVCFQTIY